MTTRFQSPSGLVVTISPSAAAVLNSFRQSTEENERGGILLGRDYTAGEVVIERVSVPSPEDKAGTNWFERSREAAQKIVNAAWEESGGEQIYLGEWHTHSEDYPNPSNRDKTMIRNMHRETLMEIDYLLLVIVGRLDIWVGMEADQKLTVLLSANR